MNTLRLEELEQRDLLSGGYFSPSAGPHSYADGGQPAMGMQRPSFGDYGGGPSRPDMGGPTWDAPPRAYEYGPQVEWVIITVRTPDHTASVSVSGPDSVGTGAVSTGAPRVPA